jgi:hypothetical protein
VLFYGLRGLCVGRVDQFDRFRCETPGRIRFDFWSGLRFLERIANSGAGNGAGTIYNNFCYLESIECQILLKYGQY